MKTILITGAGSGLGFALTKRLALAGHRVFAGVRKDEDLHRLAESLPEIVSPLICDVGNEESIAAAADEVTRSCGEVGLDCLINNAGIDIPCPLEYATREMFEQIMNTNLYGPVFMTQTFLPLLRRAKGRVLNISSTAALVHVPGEGVYSASKAALDVCSNVLRAELHSCGVEVVVVQPGYIDGPIHDKADREIHDRLQTLTEDGEERYRTLLENGLKAGEMSPGENLTAEEFAARVQQIVEKENPKGSYVLDNGSRLIKLLASIPGEGLLRRMRLSTLG